jgi:cell wall-associated NlpC family hydrolase
VINLKPTHYCLCILLAIFTTSCAAIEPAPNAVEVQTPVASITEDHQDNWPDRAREVLVNALSLTGVRYQYGGKTPESGFDCSGFVHYVFKQATSLSLPHSTLAISQIGVSVPQAELKPGDLVFFNTLKSAFSHVGIYVGNNRFIHSPRAGGKVRVESMGESYWAKRFDGAQRIEQAP